MASEHTKRLHTLLLNLSKIHLLLKHGLYVGEAAKIVFESNQWLETTHQETLTQFMAQPDYKELEPEMKLTGIQGANQ